MSVTTGVVRDLNMVAAVAAQHMSSQRRAAALFDGRHDLELTDAQVSPLRLSPRGPVGPEDIRDLQGTTPHGRGLLDRQGLQRIQGTDHLAQNVRGHLHIQRRGIELLVTKQDLDHPDIHFLFEQVRGERMPQRMQ